MLSADSLATLASSLDAIGEHCREAGLLPLIVIGASLEGALNPLDLMVMKDLDWKTVENVLVGALRSVRKKRQGK